MATGIKVESDFDISVIVIERRLRPRFCSQLV